MQRILILCAVILITQFTVHAEGPRIGILSDGGSRKEADLLLVELQKAKCELVERDEIKKVVNEQALQAGLNRAESLRVGQMLKADGLVLLTAPTANVLEVRFVAVAPGVLLWWDQLEISSKTPGAAPLPVTLAGMLTRYLPKLVVKQDAAIPISLMRARVGIQTAQADRLANELSQLLLVRLLREPSLFVLERENLKRMDEEQRWAGKDLAFWTGSYLVESTVTHDPIDTNRVTVTAIIRPPKGGKLPANEVTLQEKGGPRELPTLANRLATQLIERLAVPPSQTPWNVAQEGAQYAGLATRLSDPVQRKNAYETAMALGYRNRRIVSDYLGTLQAWAWTESGQCPPDLDNLARRRQAAERLTEMLEFCNTCPPPDGPTVEAEEWWLARCASTYCFKTPLACAGKYLEYLCKTGQVATVSDLLPQLRAECRTLANRYWLNDNFLDSARDGLCTTAYAPYFYDTTREILQVYRKLALPRCAFAGVPSVVFREQCLVNVSDQAPAFPSVATEPAATSAALWAAYRADLARPETPESRLAYWMGKMARTNTPQSVFVARRGLQSQLLADKDFALAQTNIWSLVTAAFSRVPVRLPGAEETWEHERAINMFVQLCGSERVRDEDLFKIGFPHLIDPHRSFVEWQSTNPFNSVKRPAVVQELTRLFPRQFPPAFRLPPLEVTRTGQLLCGSGQLAGPRWAQQKIWLLSGHYLVAFDPVAATCQTVPLPLAENYAITANYLVCWGSDPLAPTNQPSFAVAYRPHSATQWRKTTLPVPVTSCVEVTGRLYLSFQVPGIVYSEVFGLAVLTPATGTIETLLAPGQKPTSPTPKAALPPFEALKFGESLRATTNELVTTGRNTYGWNPSTKTLRAIAADELTALTANLAAARNPYQTAPQKFGFDISGGLGNENGKLYLTVTRAGQKDSQRVTVTAEALYASSPHYDNEQLRRDQFAVSACTRGACLTANALLLFGGSDYWEIPYADIQKCLAATPPATATDGAANTAVTPRRALSTTTITAPGEPAKVTSVVIPANQIRQKLTTARTVVVALVDDYSAQARSREDYFNATPAQMLDLYLHDLRTIEVPRPGTTSASTIALYIVEGGAQTRKQAAELFTAYRATARYDETIPVILVFREGQLVKTFTYKDNPDRRGPKLWHIVNDYLITK